MDVAITATIVMVVALVIILLMGAPIVRRRCLQV